MHDFCFTIPYGLILVAGGVVGYAKKGSTASLAGGLGTGFALLLAGYLSLKAFGKRKNSYLAMILETGCAFMLTWVMGQRYIQTSKIMPAGIVAAISVLMTGFYLYKIATGGNHIPSKADHLSRVLYLQDCNWWQPYPIEGRVRLDSKLSCNLFPMVL